MHDEHRRVPARNCPICAHKLDAVNQVAEHPEVDPPKPRPGDVTVCIRCGGMLQFAKKLQLRVLQTGTFMKLAEDEKRALLAAQRGVRAVREVH